MNPPTYEPGRAAEAVLVLIRMAFGGKPETAPFENMSEADWNGAYAFASRQGVLPIAYDGTAGLPEQLCPPKELLLRWGVNASMSEDRYARQTAVLGKLAALYAGHSIETLLLKGYGLSLYYPVPEHRECGDIDIYLFGRFDDGNRIAEEAGCSVTPAVGKHSSFVFGGVTVENHREIVNEDRNRRIAAVETLLEDMAARGALSRSQAAGASVWLPAPDFNAAYLLTHAASHFSEGELSLRNVCDWAVFLTAEGGNIDYGFMRRMLDKSRLGTFCGLMTSFCEDRLGLPPQGWQRPEAGLLNRFAETVFNFRTARAPENEKLPQRIKRVWGSRWRYRDVMHTNFLSELIYVARKRRRERRHGK